MKKISTKKTAFNDYRFNGLGWRQVSNEYVTMNRVSDEKIVVKVGDSHIIETRYGYALILDRTHVVFLKEWQVSRNYFGNEVLLQKSFFTVKEWGCFDDFESNEARLNWDYFKNVAMAQDEAVDEEGFHCNSVRWAI